MKVSDLLRGELEFDNALQGMSRGVGELSNSVMRQLAGWGLSFAGLVAGLKETYLLVHGYNAATVFTSIEISSSRMDETSKSHVPVNAQRQTACTIFLSEKRDL